MVQGRFQQRLPRLQAGRRRVRSLRRTIDQQARRATGASGEKPAGQLPRLRLVAQRRWPMKSASCWLAAAWLLSLNGTVQAESAVAPLPALIQGNGELSPAW